MGLRASGYSGEAVRLGGPGEAAGLFSLWPAWLARLALVALVALVVAAAIAPVGRPGSDPDARHETFGDALTQSANATVDKSTGDDEDIALYKAAVRRIRAGENYYAFIVSEQRARDYPVNPGIAVRLPTLAYLDAWLGSMGQIVAAMLLMVGVIWAWWRKFSESPELKRLRRMATAMVFVGASLGLNRYYFVLHELWAGMLVALSFGLHRIGTRGQGGRWIAAWLAAALALAIREHTLPYVLLMGATALWQRNWKEVGAWAVLVALFFTGLAWHLSMIAAQILPSDPHGPAWLVMRGLPGWLGNVVQSSNLRWLPHWLAGPAVILMTFGWLGWNTRAGVVAFLLSAGYGLAFVLAGRWDNFYWGAMVAPVMFAGIVFAPRALAGLVAAARLPSRVASLPVMA